MNARHGFSGIAYLLVFLFLSTACAVPADSRAERDLGPEDTLWVPEDPLDSADDRETEELADANLPPVDEDLLEGSDDPGPSYTVRGTVRYSDREPTPEGLSQTFTWKPARTVVVELVNAETGGVLGRGLTDLQGRYQVEVSPKGSPRVAVQALARVEVEGLVAEVWPTRGNSLEQGYSRRSAVQTLEQDLQMDLDLANADIPARAMNIVDVVGDAFRLARRFNTNAAPLLVVRWAPGHAYACGSCFRPNTITLGGEAADTDEYDDDIILHEAAHYLVEHLSHDDSPGGNHRDLRVHPTLAWGEGLAYFLSSVVRDDPVMIDTFEGSSRVVDYERGLVNDEVPANLLGTTNNLSTGDYREEIVAGILWDLYDAGNDEPWDQIALGDELLELLFSGFGRVLKPDLGVPGMDLVDLLNHFACTLPNPERLDGIVGAWEFPWTVGAAVCDAP